MERCMDAIRCWMIKDKLCLNERKSKTDLHGLPIWFLWSRLIIKCARVTFLLLQACLSEIYPLCRIGGLLREKRIFYENPVCHQCVFKILYRWVICCNEGQESLFTFLLLFLFKTEFIVIGTWQQLAKVNIASICVDGDANIAPVTSVKNHGSWFDHITPTLIRLHWLPACFTIEYKILILSLRQFMGLHGTIFVT